MIVPLVDVQRNILKGKGNGSSLLDGNIAMYPPELDPHCDDGVPKLYIYSANSNDEAYRDKYKLGQTRRSAFERVAEQEKEECNLHELKILSVYSARRPDGSVITDKEVFAYLKKKYNIVPVRRKAGSRTEWLGAPCTLETIKSAILAVYNYGRDVFGRYAVLHLRPEQIDVSTRTAKQMAKDIEEGRHPQALWYLKPRFGKTVASYALAEMLGAKVIVVVTYMPAVEHSWHTDIQKFYNFIGWQFISHAAGNSDGKTMEEQYAEADHSHPIVIFLSYQDLLGRSRETGCIKNSNAWLYSIEADLLIVDECHFGAHLEASKKAVGRFADDLADEDSIESDNPVLCRPTDINLRAKAHLYLSGTPYKTLGCGDFDEDQIYVWSYYHEQLCKKEWDTGRLSLYPDYEIPDGAKNPYAACPKMHILAYEIPDEIKKLLEEHGCVNDLKGLFEAEGRGKDARFLRLDAVVRFFNILSASMRGSIEDARRLIAGEKGILYPFSDSRFLESLRHFVIAMDGVSSCDALENLFASGFNPVFSNENYRIVNCSGQKAGIGQKALEKVLEAIGPDPRRTKTITITCGKCLTGVTVPCWSTIMFLRNISSNELFWQAGFRVQNPWTLDDGTIMKKDCWIIDFALQRTLQTVYNMCHSSNIEGGSTVETVSMMTRFLDIQAFDYDLCMMRSLDASEIVESVNEQLLSFSQIAKCFESSIFVNMQKASAYALKAHPRAIEILESFKRDNIGKLKHSMLKSVVSETKGVGRVERKRQKSNNAEASEQEEPDACTFDRCQSTLMLLSSRLALLMASTSAECSLKGILQMKDKDAFHRAMQVSLDDFAYLASLGVFNTGSLNEALYRFRLCEARSRKFWGIMQADSSAA